MKKILAIFALAIFCASPFISKAQEPSSQNYIQISTTTEREVIPDEIYVSIVIKEEAGKGKPSLDKIESDMIKALKSINIDATKNLSVNDMESQLKTYFLRADNILASKIYLLKLSSAKEASDAIKVLNQLKIHDISIEKTSISKELMNSVKNELMIEAGQKAKANAETLAKSVGSTAGNVIYIQYYESTYSPSISRRDFAKGLVLSEINLSQQDENLEMTKSKISVNVLYRFDIKK